MNEGPKLEPDAGLDCSIEQAETASTCAGLHYSSTDGLCCPMDDRTAWKVLRSMGHNGYEAAGLLSNVLRPLRNDLPDVPSNTSIPPIESITHPLFPGGDIEDVPGLKIVPVTHEHLDAASALAVETGLYPGVCPGPNEDHPHECSPPEAHAWMHIAAMIDRSDGMAMALEYKGTPLQIEILKIDGPTVTMGFTVHFTRERPHWFWREAEQPVFDALRSLGFSKLQSFIRKDRSDWVKNLEINYGAIETGGTQTLTKLEMPLDGHFKGWPERRTMGAGWTWQRDGLIVREGTEDDFPGLMAFLDSTYEATSTQLPIVKRMVDWWWNLDRAAMLIGVEGGDITHVRMIRHRRGTVSSVGMVSRAGALTGPFIDGMRAWQAGVGYTKGTMFVPDRIASAAEVQQAMAATQAKGTRVLGTHTKFREPFVEIEWDV